MEQFIKYGLLISVGASLLVLEMYFDTKERREARSTHVFRNLSFGVMGSLIVGIFYMSVLTAASTFSATSSFVTFMDVTPFHTVINVIILFLLFDLVLYFWHLSNHKLPFLWRFHQVHHSDADLDFSSAVRFHAGELLISILVKALFLIVTGAPLLWVAVFDVMVTLFALYNHANLSMERVDWLIRKVIVTPDMHRIHHSQHQKETDSNYTTMLSFWDKVFGTYTEKTAYDDGVGLGQYKEKKSRTFWKMIVMPFRKK